MHQHNIIDRMIDSSYRALHLLHRNLVNLPSRKSVHHDLAILSMLVANGPMLASELAAKLASTRPQMTQFIDRLEKKGAVLRKNDTEDRRRVQVEITDEGRATLSRYRAIIRKHFAKTIERLETRQAEDLFHALEQIIEITQKLAIDGDSND